MADGDAQGSVTAAAAANLRETAKWLFTGIVATAGGVVAGSSLTKLGSLDWNQRFATALFGAAVGFLALGWLANETIAMLRRDVVTARMLATDNAYASVRDSIDAQFAGFQLDGAQGMADLLVRLDAEFAKPAADRDAELLRNGNALLDMMADVGTFYVVREQFDRLVEWMWLQLILIIVGFGLFAWAANPADKPAEKGVTVKVVE